ncbi:LysR family transcriptional regulator [beta proteobacterium AAP121]|nr:LysR family transcriptional regulator [beta proteobacterium AAP65]KPG00668.1 LysR family transcriptional regulator [beta proteobacterium AAP121]
MLDYPLVAAVAAVLREGSFERAAEALHLTPSAVSQRVKLLEERLGQPLVVRGGPCSATAAGAALARHAEALRLLEADLAEQLPGLGDASAPTLPLAVNADSLATWFLPALARLGPERGWLFDLRLEDQDHTAEQLARGEVLAAVTALATPQRGCRSLALGALRYRATASPAFVARHFAAGVNATTLASAPCLVFNRQDRMQARWVEARLGRPLAVPRHWLPSPQAFVDAALAGLGWGLNPEPLVLDLLARGALVDLPGATPVDVPLHWQTLRAADRLLQPLTRAVADAARTVLHPEKDLPA